MNWCGWTFHFIWWSPLFHFLTVIILTIRRPTSHHLITQSTLTLLLSHLTHCKCKLQRHWNISVTFEYIFSKISSRLLQHVRDDMCWISRLNWARRTAWWWKDEWDGTALQTQDSKFEPWEWRSEAEHATSRSRRLPTILNLYEWAEKKHSISLKLDGHSGVQTRDYRLSKHCTKTPALILVWSNRSENIHIVSPLAVSTKWGEGGSIINS